MEEVKSRKRRAYSDLQCPSSPPEKKRESLFEFLHCEATIRDQVRVRVFECTERCELEFKDENDILKEEVDQVLEHSLEHNLDPHKVWYSSKALKCIVDTLL